MDDGVCAVRPGIDLGRYARELSLVHDAVLAGTHPPSRPRSVVERSWRRVQQHGVNPDLQEPPGPLPFAEIEFRRTRSPLRAVLPELRSALTWVAEDARHVMVVTDASGVVLWREGSARVRHGADKLGFTEGANWSEGAVGTNAIGTALAEDAPVQIFSAEHFVRSHHVWTCTAAPVHDPRTGELLGVVDVSGPAPTVHSTTVALVGTAVKLAEASLLRSHERQLDALRIRSSPLLAAVPGPGLVVDDHGWVAAVRNLPPLERVAPPHPDRPLHLPGLGLCRPERVPGGWLLRPGGHEQRVRLRLQLRDDPRAVVSQPDGGDPWVQPLTSRHTEILTLLAGAGPAGLDGASLSRALYGSTDHVVAVRVEMSRLRRGLGGLLLARPYRFAPCVDLELDG